MRAGELVNVGMAQCGRSRNCAFFKKQYKTCLKPIFFNNLQESAHEIGIKYVAATRFNLSKNKSESPDL